MKIGKIKLVAALLLVCGSLFFAGTAFAEEKLNIYFFYGDGCPHCAKEEVFLETVKEKYPQINVHSFEIYFHPENIETLQRLNSEMGIEVDGVPLTIIGDTSFVGFSETGSSEKMEDRINYCLENSCTDRAGEIIDASSNESGSEQKEGSEEENEIGKITVPFFGEIDPASFSLPALTVVMGALDGFNPCAMWTLLFLISLLLGMENRKRMWILGVAFIAASAAVYFLFMAAWLNLILFLGFIIWVRIAIGLIALAGGGYNLREFFINKEAVCKVTQGDEKKKIFDKIKSITQMNSLWLALGGIVLLAFAVNLVELVCSAGLPAIYTQILALSNLPVWQYYLYIGLYIFVFMLDDLFVFFAAMITLEMAGITGKYARASKLIGGILMLAIGLLLIFRPEILMFG
ncbi:MAG: hypothetical protein PHP35_01635 [Candidatus Colwellbacteria bacterium]|nr:hypothetical protein [Candidatus Colwellbacteria bacterium]